MTAEVVVMNRLGVALAADSATTISIDRDDPQNHVEKIYASSDKLFLLAQDGPIGVMVYGNADFLHVPWETIVKLYRHCLGHRTFGTVDDYVYDFIKFLANELSLFPESARKDFVGLTAGGFYYGIRSLFEENLKAEFGTKTEITEQEIEEALQGIVTRQLEETRRFAPIGLLPDDFAEKVRAAYSDVITGWRTRVFGKLPRSPETDQALFDLILELLSRERLGPDYSGLVFAGFGELEHFPAMCDVKVTGIVANNVLFSKAAPTRMGSGTGANVVAFAQPDVVSTFMEGIDPSLMRHFERSTKVLYGEMGREIISIVKQHDANLGEVFEQKLPAILDAAVGKCIEKWTARRREGYTEPVLDIIEALPKDELAVTAETLVNLTKFKRRVSREPETVGGPIDVAVITKGDGFVWVKRKHYFDPALNPRVIARYYRGGA